MAGIVSNDDIRGAQSRLTIEEGNELLAGALGAKGKGDRGEAVDGIETKQDIIMLGELLARPEIAADASWELGRGGSLAGMMEAAAGWETSGGGEGGVGGISYLQLVHQHRDGVELVIGVLRVRHNERGRWVRVEWWFGGVRGVWRGRLLGGGS